MEQPIELEWVLEQAGVRPYAKRLLSSKYSRILLAERRRKRTVLEWFLKKGLITANEFLAGRALAILIEWRAASFGAASSVEVFARKLNVAPPMQIAPYECGLLVRGSDDDAMGEAGTTIDIDDFRLNERTRNGVVVFNETIRQRLQQHLCAIYELPRVADLLRRALPERPDLMVILGHAVTERIRVDQLPHPDAEILYAALHVVRQLWQYDLLEDAINKATGFRDASRPSPKPRHTVLPPTFQSSIERCSPFWEAPEYEARHEEQRRAETTARHSRPGRVSPRAGRKAAAPRDGDRQPRKAKG